MTRFFDPTTKKLHVVAHASKEALPKDVAARCITVKESGELGVDGSERRRLLRRSNAVTSLDELPLFFSKEDHRLYRGSYNLDAEHNQDLVPVSETVQYEEQPSLS